MAFAIKFIAEYLTRNKVYSWPTANSIKEHLSVILFTFFPTGQPAFIKGIKDIGVTNKKGICSVSWTLSNIADLQMNEREIVKKYEQNRNKVMILWVFGQGYIAILLNHCYFTINIGIWDVCILNYNAIVLTIIWCGIHWLIIVGLKLCLCKAGGEANVPIAFTPLS